MSNNLKPFPKFNIDNYKKKQKFDPLKQSRPEVLRESTRVAFRDEKGKQREVNPNAPINYARSQKAFDDFRKREDIGYTTAALSPLMVDALPTVISMAAPYVESAMATQLPGLASIPGATVGNALTSYFVTHGLTNVTPDAKAFIKNPSWEKAGDVGMDMLEIFPAVGPASKILGEELSSAGQLTKQGLRKGKDLIHPVNTPAYMSLEAPKGNMYGENQVLVQQQRLLNPEIKAKFFEHQAPIQEPYIEKDLLGTKYWKQPKDYGNRITPENYDDFIKNIHSSTGYDLANEYGYRPGNLGVGNYGKQGVVFSDAPLNNLGKDIINAHEKNHGIFVGTLSKEMKTDLLKPFGTKKPLSGYPAKHQEDEVLARMAQFKNALGMGDDQIFTLGHLNLIRKNYANHFIDNSITEMLSKIKPGSSGEKEFLKNMNKYAFGITAGAVGTKAALPTEKQGGLIKAQFGWFDDIKNKISHYFDDDLKKPVTRKIVPAVRTLHINDPRKIRATTQQPIRPNVDLLTGSYSSIPLDQTLREAKRQGLSKQDMWNLAGMALAETGLGNKSYNIGQVISHPGDEGEPGPKDFVYAYIDKMKKADKLGYKDLAMRLQVYNGLGAITPDTEKSIRGYKMQKAYGVTLPKEGISMKKRPLYGINVLDAQNNVLRKNPEFVKYMDSIYAAPVYKNGGKVQRKQNKALNWINS